MTHTHAASPFACPKPPVRRQHMQRLARLRRDARRDAQAILEEMLHFIAPTRISRHGVRIAGEIPHQLVERLSLVGIALSDLEDEVDDQSDDEGWSWDADDDRAI